MADLERAYTLIISATPALHRAWREAPNPIARKLNGQLHDAAVVWCREYQAATGRDDQGLRTIDEIEATRCTGGNDCKVHPDVPWTQP